MSNQPTRKQLADVNDLIHRTLGLPPALLWSYFDQLVGRPEVSAIGWRIVEKRLSQEKYPERNAEILDRHDKGESYNDLAPEYGLSPSGIAKICQRAREKAVDAKTMSTALSLYDCNRAMDK